ncbi:sensor histidine kinase [Verrucosispora sp. WMMD703]|uniref:sensor histidine kinase n=1 Tax=Verrucosispora sp. WMMD703 TaxID=3403463 RepID=UPI003B95A765
MSDHSGTVTDAVDVPGPPRLTRWFDERLTRVGVTGRFARDCLLAALLTVLMFLVMALLFRYVAPAQGLSFGPARVWLVTALCSGQAMLLCLRRVRPRLCLALVVGLQVPVIVLSVPEATIRGIAPFVAAYTVGTLLPLRSALLAAGAAVVVETSSVAVAVRAADAADFAIGGPGPGPLVTTVGHLATSALVYAGLVFVGSYVATYRRYLQLVRVRADEAVRAQQATVRAAIGAERARMARELHDVAAHHLSGMVVQAAAAERLIDPDPSAAKTAVAWIRSQGKETLDNLRLVVGVLRGRPGDSDGNAPVPGLAMLDDLVSDARQLGSPVEFVRHGQHRDVPPIADVALYRIVQESLSNARQHAPGAPVRVQLRFLPRQVSLEVSNDRPTRRAEPRSSATGGIGLVGMRERAHLIGAQFTAGPTTTGGWSVTVTVPTTGDDARATGATATVNGDDQR